MAGDVLGISVSGALASQRALSTTGHNIANANTEGYSRQRVELGTRPPQMAGNGAIGTGVSVNNVGRVYDEFVTSEVRQNTALHRSFEASYEFTSQVDNLLSDPNVGLSPALQSFFAAVNGVASDPSSTSARQVLLSEARALGERFRYMNDRLESLRQGVGTEMKNIIADINDIAAAIASINDTIIKAREMGGNSPSDLLDQRDRLVQKLAELVGVRVNEQDDGQLNVFIGNGQTLVIGSLAAELDVERSRFDPNEAEIVFKGSGGKAIITQFINGGRLGGVLDFRDDVLNTAQNELGRIAISISNTFNHQHRLGMDLENQLGGNFFTQSDRLTPKVLPHTRNQGDALLQAQITDIDKLTTSDYSLTYRDGNYRLIRLEDDQLIGDFDRIPLDVKSEGFRIEFERGSSFENGDTFVIRPTRQGAEYFRPVLENVKRIAAASPVRTEPLITNQGDATISAGLMVDASNPGFAGGRDLKPPFAIRFIDPTHYEILDNSGDPIPIKLAAVPATPAIRANAEGRAEPATPASPAQPPKITTVLEYDPLNGADVFPTPDGTDYGFRVRIDGRPAAGDTFRIEYNTDAVGDNANALRLARLQSEPVLDDSSSTYSQVYSQLVSRVGSKTHELEINGKAQKLLLDQAIERREAVSGVNLDEEAANMVRYQNLYQANAKVISVANKLMEELINAFR